MPPIPPRRISGTASPVMDLTVPALLVSYVYLPDFLANKHQYAYRDWALDSGAFTAQASGQEIKLQDYIDECKRLSDSPDPPSQIFSLDVIGDWRATLRNTEEMWRQGVEAVPTFHHGEPWDAAKGMAKDYPRMAVGGIAGERAGPRDRWLDQVFARIWPAKIHGFGLCGERTVMRFPFVSVDATSWEITTCKYGTWRSFGYKQISIRGSTQPLRLEVQWFMELERKARHRWRNEMRSLLGDQSGNHPTVRMVANGDVVCERQLHAFGKPGLTDPKTLFD